MCGEHAVSLGPVRHHTVASQCKCLARRAPLMWPSGRRWATKHYALTTTGRPPADPGGAAEDLATPQGFKLRHNLFDLVSLPGRLEMPVVELMLKCGLQYLEIGERLRTSSSTLFIIVTARRVASACTKKFG